MLRVVSDALKKPRLILQIALMNKQYSISFRRRSLEVALGFSSCSTNADDDHYADSLPVFVLSGKTRLGYESNQCVKNGRAAYDEPRTWQRIDPPNSRPENRQPPRPFSGMKRKFGGDQRFARVERPSKPPESSAQIQVTRHCAVIPRFAFAIPFMNPRSSRDQKTMFGGQARLTHALV